MPKIAKIDVKEGNPSGAVQNFLKSVLESGDINAILAPGIFL